MIDARQAAEDRQALRDHLWEHREVITEYALMHDCLTGRAFRAAIRLVGWKPDAFYVADLVNRRDLLDG